MTFGRGDLVFYVNRPWEVAGVEPSTFQGHSDMLLLRLRGFESGFARVPLDRVEGRVKPITLQQAEALHALGPIPNPKSPTARKRFEAGVKAILSERVSRPAVKHAKGNDWSAYYGRMGGKKSARMRAGYAAG